LIAACATTAERRAAERAGLDASLIGLGGVNGLPDGELVSFGLAGALNGLPTGTVVDAVRVVDEQARTLWEGEPLGVPGARTGTVLATDRVVDDPAERSRLHDATGADVVDLESGVLAASGRLRGCLRAVSGTPERTLHGICRSVHPSGTYDWPGLAGAFLRSPRGFSQAAADAKRALSRLTEAARSLQQTVTSSQANVLVEPNLETLQQPVTKSVGPSGEEEPA
jgi:hypothetical protein